MRRLNVVMLVDETGEKLLMCRRRKEPYKGLYNFVGGKVEEGEDDLHGAYRELREETGITAADAALHHVATFYYPSSNNGPAYMLASYVGRLRCSVNVAGDENPLEWLPMKQDFFDINRFAGEGSVGHIVETVRRYRQEWLQPDVLDIKLSPIADCDLPLIAYYQNTAVTELERMLEASRCQEHEGRYYEQFAVRVNGCMAGMVSLYEQDDGSVCDGVDIFPTFRRCGFARQALAQVMDIARARGFTAQTAQIRTNNTASIALHKSLGFLPGETWINRNGNEVRTWRRELS